MFSTRRAATTLAGLLLAVAWLAGSWAPDETPASHASPTPNFNMGPGGLKTQGSQGSYFTELVYVENVTGLGGFSFEVHFDDTVLSVTEIEEQTFLSQGGPTACASSTSIPGQVTMGCVLTGGGAGVSGSGWLAHVSFAFDQDYYGGSVQLDLQDCQAADPDGDPIALNGCTGTTWTVNPPPPPAPMTMQPSSMKAQAPPGSTFTFDVAVGDVTNLLGGLEFAVEFDDAVLNVSDIREGPFLGSEGGETICFFNPIPGNPSSTRAEFFCVVLGKEGPTGSGVIAHVDVTMKAPFVGTTALVLADCDLADEQGNNIPVSECTGATLQTNPTPTATPTHTPTVTPITPQDVGGISRDPAAGSPARSTRSSEGSSWLLAATVMAALAASAGCAAYAVRRAQR